MFIFTLGFNFKVPNYQKTFPSNNLFLFSHALYLQVLSVYKADYQYFCRVKYKREKRKRKIDAWQILLKKRTQRKGYFQNARITALFQCDGAK
jgi:hypothetical protein